MVIRVVWVLVHKGNEVASGDAYYFFTQGSALAQGDWFISPLAYDLAGVSIDAAHHPPLYSLFLGGLSVIGLDEPLVQRLASAMLGIAAVIVIGLVARRLAGDRAGVIAAVLAAVYPNLWINDAQLMSESLYALLLAGLLWFAFAYRQSPSLASAARLGAVVGITALTRTEALMMFALVALPLVVAATPGWRTWFDSWRTKLAHLVVLGGVGVLIMAPWVAYNLNRFEKPVYLSYGAAGVLPQANCDETYSGPLYAYWSPRCFQLSSELQDGRPDPAETLRLAAQALGIEVVEGDIQELAAAESPEEVGELLLDIAGDDLDESIIAEEARGVGLDYIRAHAAEVPVVAMARVGRMYGVFRPLQTMRLDEQVESRGYYPVRLGAVLYAELVILSVIGAVMARRRGISLVPFMGLVAVATITALVAIGLTRYRLPVDVVLCVLGALGIEALVRHRTGRNRRRLPAT